MKISELIETLQKIENEEGDLNVCTSQIHEYWGSTEDMLEQYSIDIGNAQPDGPKSGKFERAVILGRW